MWGDYEDKFPQARSFYMYLFTHPGKKLTFMGSEFAQFREWDETKEQDWFMLKYPKHDSFREYFGKLGELYTSRPALYCGDYNNESFRWLIVNDESECVYAYERICGEEVIVCVFNFSDKEKVISLPLGERGILSELLNSEWDIYSGSVHKPESPERYISHGFLDTPELILAPFCGRMFELLPLTEEITNSDHSFREEPLHEGSEKGIVIIECDDE